MNKILIADDMAGRRLEISEWLEAAGWQIIAVEDADEALQMLDQENSSISLIVGSATVVSDLVSSWPQIPSGTGSVPPVILLGVAPAEQQDLAPALRIAGLLSGDPEEAALLEHVQKVLKK